MKIYQSIEQIFKFRIHSNEEIPSYLKKMATMGKFDGIRHNALLALVLTRLGMMEDAISVIEKPVEQALQGGGFQCKECGKVLKTRIGLAGHQRSHKKT